VGFNNFLGAPPQGGGRSQSPEASRMRSMQIQDQLTRATHEIEEGLTEEVIHLRKFNKTAGIDIDAIDTEAKINAELDEANEPGQIDSKKSSELESSGPEENK
jgi:hypothetical protein